MRRRRTPYPRACRSPAREKFLASSAARRGKRTVQQALKERFDADPDGVAEIMFSAAKQGRDLRGMLNALGVAYEDDARVEIPSTLDEAVKLSREERRALMHQPEAELGVSGLATTSQLLASASR